MVIAFRTQDVLSNKYTSLRATKWRGNPGNITVKMQFHCYSGLDRHAFGSR